MSDDIDTRVIKGAIKGAQKGDEMKTGMRKFGFAQRLASIPGRASIRVASLNFIAIHSFAFPVMESLGLHLLSKEWNPTQSCAFPPFSSLVHQRHPTISH